MNAPRPQWWPAYVGLGSNLEDPKSQVERAFIALAELPDTRFVLKSSLYRSAPMGPQDQPDFINAAAGLLTRLSPEDLLAELQRIEREQGRQRTGQRWGPRTLDLDLLGFGPETRATAELTLPHPRITERNFVLLPLAEIAPELSLPGLSNVRELGRRVSDNEPLVEKL